MAIKAALEIIQANQSVTVVTPLLRNLDASIQTSNRRFPSVLSEAARVFGLDRHAGSRCSTPASAEARIRSS